MPKRKYNKTVDNNGDPQHDSKSEFQKLRDELTGEMRKQRTELEEIKKIAGASHAHSFEKFKLIQDLISPDNQPDKAKEKKDEATSTDSSSELPLNNLVENTPGIVKTFMLKHRFEDADTLLSKWDAYTSEVEEHFGVRWFIRLALKDKHVQVFLYTDHPTEDFEIETEFDLKVIGNKKPDVKKTFTYSFKGHSGWGGAKFLKYKEMKDYLVGGSLTAEAHVRIIETKAFGKGKIRSFDESIEEVSDVVMVVNERKFFVNKKYLALQSSYFKALLLGNFKESKQSEVRLHGIDPEDFHFFLEVLHGESSIDESNVEGITLLADMYDAPTVIRRCEEFMNEKSKKTLKRKLQIANKYHLDGFKKKCLSEIKTSADIRAVMPNNWNDLQRSTVVALFEKSMELGGF